MRRLADDDVHAIALPVSSQEFQITIYRADPNDAPTPINTDHYRLWEGFLRTAICTPLPLRRQRALIRISTRTVTSASSCSKIRREAITGSPTTRLKCCC